MTSITKKREFLNELKNLLQERVINNENDFIKYMHLAELLDINAITSEEYENIKQKYLKFI